MDLFDIAKIAHEVNRSYARSIGDTTIPRWQEAPQWMRESVINGVKYHLDSGLNATPEQSHENWMALKQAEGWKWGPVKDYDKKEHPCMVPYSHLPTEQRTKDYLFTAVVHNLAGYLIS